MTFFAETDISGCAVNQMKKLDNYAFLLKIFACRAYISETKRDREILRAFSFLQLFEYYQVLVFSSKFKRIWTGECFF